LGRKYFSPAKISFYKFSTIPVIQVFTAGSALGASVESKLGNLQILHTV